MSATQNFLIEGNPRYNIIPEGTFLLQNCAEGVEHIIKPSNSPSSNQIDFSMHVNDRFLERSVNLQIDEIPLVITRNFAATGVTLDNFVTTFFDNYTKLTLSEFGFLNAIEFLSISLDGKQVSTQTPGEILRALAQYYDRDQLHKYFPASTTDLFYNHDLYESGDRVKNNLKHSLKTVSGKSKPIVVKRPVFNEADPYTSGGLDNTAANRTPTIKFTGWDSNELRCSLVDVSVPLPLSLFTIGADDLPIYNCDRIDVKIILKPDWVQYLFNVRNLINDEGDSASIYENIRFDQENLKAFVSELSYRSYTPPAYIAEKLNSNQPYYMNYPLIEIASTISNTKPVLPLASEQVNISIPNMKAIPKKILVYAKPKYNNGMEFARSSNYYGRIDSLNVKMNGVSTPICSGNGLTLFDLCKKEGLNLTKEVALYSKGYAVLLDVSNSLSCKTNTLIGAMDGVKNLDLQVMFTNLNSVADTTSYEIKVICIYDAIFAYKHNGVTKFDIIESILPSDYRSTTLHAEGMYDKTIKGMNMIGGSFWSAIGDIAKKIGTGVKNVFTGVIQNRNGFRDNLVNAWNGAGSMDNHYPINGGAVIHNSNNRVGGKSVDSWSVRK